MFYVNINNEKEVIMTKICLHISVSGSASSRLKLFFEDRNIVFDNTRIAPPEKSKVSVEVPSTWACLNRDILNSVIREFDSKELYIGVSFICDDYKNFSITDFYGNKIEPITNKSIRGEVFRYIGKKLNIIKRNGSDERFSMRRYVVDFTKKVPIQIVLNMYSNDGSDVSIGDFLNEN